jgi:protein SCO1/2
MKYKISEITRTIASRNGHAARKGTLEKILQHRICVLGALCVSLFWGYPADGAGSNFVCRSCCRLELAPHAFTDKSLYQVESVWTTDGQKQIKLGTLAGKPQIVLMFFSRCTTACPILINNLRQIESALTPETRAKIGVTLVSFDTERDTPASLAEYRRAWNLPENWTLLSGKQDDVLELAALLGIQYKQTADGQFAHSNVITLMNAQGEIVLQQAGLDSRPEEMVRHIKQLRVSTN